MERRPEPFTKNTCRLLSLPLEIRNYVYGYALGWPDLSRTFANFTQWKSYDARCDEEKRPHLAIPGVDEMWTPTVLLLNRQITAEALAELYRQALVLTSPFPHSMVFPSPTSITEFISEASLQQVRMIELDMDLNYDSLHRNEDANEWSLTVASLLDIWYKNNHLEKVEVRRHYVEGSKALGWTFSEAAHHRSVIGLMAEVCKQATVVIVILIDMTLAAGICESHSGESGGRLPG